MFYGKNELVLFCEEPKLCVTPTEDDVNSGVVVNINKSIKKKTKMKQNQARVVLERKDIEIISYFCKTSERFLLFGVGLWI